VPDECPLIAGVLKNRLARGMRLEVDPTLVYGPATWAEVPAPRHRRDATNPFNTYARAGLPPAPICSPGRVALQAARHPAATDALYYVARRAGTGRHAFAVTFEEHRENVRKYLH